MGKALRLAVLAITAGSAAACANPAPPRTPTAQPTYTPPGNGQLVGRIQRCYGTGLPPNQTPQFVGGTIDVYPDGSPQGGSLAAHAELPDNGMFHFTLPAGGYAVIARWTGSDLPPMLVEAVVTAGATTRVPIEFLGCR